MKIRTQLTLWFTLQVALIVGVGGLVVWLGIKRSLYLDATQEAHDKTEEIALFIQTTAQDYQHRNQKFDLTTNTLIKHYIYSSYHTQLYGNIFLQLSSSSEQPLFRSANLEHMYLPILATGTIGQLTISLPRRPELKTIYANTPLELNGNQIGSLQVAISLIKPEQFLNNLLRFEIIGFVMSVLASLLLGQVLAKRAMMPMLKVTGEVQSMTEGLSLFKRLDISALPRDEIGHLAGTFNSLLERLELLFNRQKQFAEDASHELKSPLTAIRGHVQLLEKRGLEHPEIFQESTSTIYRESERLSRLIDDLLLLARMEKRPVKFHRVNLSEQLQQMLNELQPVYPQLKGFNGSPDIWIEGEESELKRVFINLLDNALRAAGETGQVNLSWELLSTHVAIYIADNGSGIPEIHIPHVFERFYRAEQARDRNSGGSGLGLSMVHEIIIRHMGCISIHSEVGVGTTFTLLLPLPLEQPV